MARSVVRSVRLDALRVGKALCSMFASTVRRPRKPHVRVATRRSGRHVRRPLTTIIDWWPYSKSMNRG
jgi:hypothetical protein